MNPISSRLAAKLGTRQLDALAHTDAAADNADAAVVALWDQLAALLRDHGEARERDRTMVFPPRLRHAVAHLVGEMFRASHRSLSGSLTALANWGHQSAAGALAQTLPAGYLRAAARAQGNGGPFTEAVILGVDDSGRLQTDDLTAALSSEAPDDEQQRANFASLLFPPPTADQVARILRTPVHGSTWEQDLAGATRLASPDKIASLVVAGFSSGQDWRQVAKDVMPAVQGVKTTARRVARTFGMQVAHGVQMQAHEQLGDLLVGYQIHAQMDQHTRPWHAARSGTVYYREPGPGQKGYAQMPNPPLEAEDASERPAGTPRLAFNCRCWTAPVLRDSDEIAADPIFADAPGAPDPAVFSDWFDAADDRSRRLAVGARRYALMRDRVNGTPSWEHFVDPATGQLLPADVLHAETDEARADRVAQVRALLARNRRQTQDVARVGFVLPAQPSGAVPPAVPAAVSTPVPITRKRPASVHVPGHGTISFVPDPVANPRGNVTILVNPALLDADWAGQGDVEYIPPGGGGAEVAGRRQGFEDWLQKGQPIEASRVSLDADGRPSFTNGRHRFSVLRDKGASAVAVTVPKNEADEFARRYGATAVLPEPAAAGVPSGQQLATAGLRGLGNTAGNKQLLVATVNGQDYVVKELQRTRAGPEIEASVHELAKAVGIETPPVQQVQVPGIEQHPLRGPASSGKWLAMPKVEGKAAPEEFGKLTRAQQKTAADEFLLSYAVGNRDRNDANYIVRKDGKLVAFDYEASFGPETDPQDFIDGGFLGTAKKPDKIPLDRKTVQGLIAKEQEILTLASRVPYDSSTATREWHGKDAANEARHRLVVLKELAKVARPTVADLKAAHERLVTAQPETEAQPVRGKTRIQ